MSKLERILILDLTTVGKAPADGQIIESAGVLLDLAHAEVIEARSICVHAPENPDEEVNGLSIAFLRSLPRSIAPYEGDEQGVHQLAIELLFAMAKRADAFVAHDAVRVARWLPRSLERQLPWICTRFGCDWSSACFDCYGGGLASLASAHEVDPPHGVGPVTMPRALDDCLAIAKVMREVRQGELGLHAPDLLEILERGLARGAGEPPRCEHGLEAGDQCHGYVRTYLRADAIMGKRRCVEHGGSWQWIS